MMTSSGPLAVTVDNAQAFFSNEIRNFVGLVFGVSLFSLDKLLAQWLADLRTNKSLCFSVPTQPSKLTFVVSTVSRRVILLKHDHLNCLEMLI